MKSALLFLAVLLLISSVYIGALSVVSNQNLRPPTLKYILTEITSYEYYVNVKTTISDIERIWSSNSDTIAGTGADGGSRFPEDTPSWVISFSTWLETSTIGKVFLTISSVVEFIALSVYDTVLALVYVFKIFSVFLTGVPV